MKIINYNLDAIVSPFRELKLSILLILKSLVSKIFLYKKNIILEKEQLFLQEQNFNLLRKVGILENLVKGQEDSEIYEFSKHQEAKKVVLLGSAQLPVHIIYAVAKAFGYDKCNIEVYGDYNKNKRLDTRLFRNTDKYSGILVGPIAHKIVGLGDNNSVLSKITNEPGYPKCCVIRTKSGHLKITKTALKKAFIDLSEQAATLEKVA